MSKRAYRVVDFLNIYHQTGDFSHMLATGWGFKEELLSSGRRSKKKVKKEGSFLKERFSFSSDFE